MNKESIEFIWMLRNAMKAYINTGCSSCNPMRTHIIHNFLCNKIKKHLPHGYSGNIEQYVVATNASGRKKCDIVVNKYSTPYIVFPIKFIMGNYNQNKNNYFENLTGELCHLKWATSINICPINIIFNKVPYRNNKKIIKKFEVIKYENTLGVYKELMNNGLCENVVNYIIQVEWKNDIGEPITNVPIINGFNKKTPYIPVSELLLKWEIM